jgi:hypothetical protein
VGFYPYVKEQLGSLQALSDTHIFTIPAFQVPQVSIRCTLNLSFEP